MKMRSAFFLFTFIIVALLAFTLALFESAITQMEKDGDRMREIAARATLAEKVESVIRTHNRQAFLYLLTKNPQILSRKLVTKDEIERVIAQMREGVTSEAEMRLVSEMDHEVQAYFKVRQKVEDSGVSPLRGYEVISREIDEIAARASAVAEYSTAKLAEIENRSLIRATFSQRAGMFAGALAVALVLFGLVGGYFYIYQPLVDVADGLRLFGASGKSPRLNPKGPVEIREIAFVFNKMADQLEQRKVEQVKFLASVAHDLRNPLNSILMSSEILISKCDREGGREDDKKLLEIIRRQMKALDRLVGDLLDTTRIETGHFDLKMSFCEIGRLLRDAVNLHRSSLTIHEIKLTLPENAIYSYCDPARISQVINNLISNAIKYSPNGGTIEISAAQTDDDVCIQVRDRGIGIGPKDLDTIFEPFRRSESTRSMTLGIGLGLSASRKIVEAHHGKIQVESQLGKGSTFTVILPQTGFKKGQVPENPSVRLLTGRA